MTIQVGDRVKMTCFYSEKYSDEWVQQYKDQIALVLASKHKKIGDTDSDAMFEFDELVICYPDNKCRYIVSNFGYSKV